MYYVLIVTRSNTTLLNTTHVQECIKERDKNLIFNKIFI